MQGCIELPPHNTHTHADPVSYGRTVQRHITKDEGFLSYPASAIVTIFSKDVLTTAEGEYWGAEVRISFECLEIHQSHQHSQMYVIRSTLSKCSYVWFWKCKNSIPLIPYRRFKANEDWFWTMPLRSWLTSVCLASSCKKKSLWWELVFCILRVYSTYSVVLSAECLLVYTCTQGLAIVHQFTLILVFSHEPLGVP